ncbi:MAG: methyltransferase domain-containing protein [Ectothiorhodospiraceae bacterium]|nr:methyltransferase domain-containing protein [Ectothiorhodospiraceae bacterium]
MRHRDIDQDKLNAFLSRWTADQAATLHAATVVIGDKLGLYQALAQGGRQTARELAAATGLNRRLVREWLNAQVASGYCQFQPESTAYWLTPEQAACLAEPESPTFVAGGALVSNASHQDTDRVVQAFMDDGGIGWHEHHHHLFEGTQRFFEPIYRRHLVQDWIPALDGMEARLRRGAQVADIGCGQGACLILMARAFPDSRFIGFDYHADSIKAAQRNAEEAQVADRVSFQVAGAQDFEGEDFDLICVFNALHEWGDAVGAASRIREALAPDGLWMFTEPLADPHPQVSVRGRTFFSVSTCVCTPSALSQGGRESLGAQAGEAELRRVTEAAGFTRFRRAAETPMFMVLEAS